MTMSSIVTQSLLAVALLSVAMVEAAPLVSSFLFKKNLESQRTCSLDVSSLSFDIPKSSEMLEF